MVLAPKSSKLRKWITREINDHIFIWFSVDPDQIAWEIPIVPEIERKEFVYHGRNEFYVNCHIQEIPENGADIAHFAAIHNANILLGSGNTNSNFFKSAGKHNWSAKSIK